MIKRVFILMVFSGMLITSCQPVKLYQRTYLNDREMKMGHSAAEKTETNAMTYREGAAGGGTGKSSGGCGCN